MTLVRRGGRNYIVKVSEGRVKFSKVCKWCGEEFLSARTTAKYCSNVCKQKSYRYRNDK